MILLDSLLHKESSAVNGIVAPNTFSDTKFIEDVAISSRVVLISYMRFEFREGGVKKSRGRGQTSHNLHPHALVAN